MSFFISMKPKIFNRGFAVLPRWADAPTLPKKVLAHFNTLSIFPTEILLELLCFVASTFSDAEAICKKKWTLWNYIVDIGVPKVDERCSNESIARYMSTTRLL